MLCVQDRDARCQAALIQHARAAGMATSHIFMDLLELASAVNLAGGGLVLGRCCLHGQWCEVQPCHMDVTGTPCQDFAPTGKRLGVHGPQWPVFLAWVAVILSQCPSIVVHENVPQFPAGLLQHFLGHAYLVYTLLVDCEAVGFRLISRKRRYTILYHRLKVAVMFDPAAVYSQMIKQLSPILHATAWHISDCFLANTAELVTEISDLCAARNVAPCSALNDMTLLLTAGEKQRLVHYLRLWAQRFGLPAHCFSWAVFNLGDNPDAGYVTWSGSSGRLPSLRTHGTKYWCPFLGRWLTTRELLACMGLPVYPALAASAGVAMVHIPTTAAARHMLGNMMHLASAGSVMAVALSCCRLA